MTNRYRDCGLKIERAMQHVQELQTGMGKISADDSYVITIQPDPHGGDDRIKLAAVEVIPGPLLCILGDAIHNLRTALDFAMMHMVGNPTRFTKFPIRNTRQELVAAVNGGLKDYASKYVIDYIVDFVQPYPGGRGEPIWAAHTLDIQDKHGTLIAHNELKFVSGIRGIDDRGVEFEVPTWLIAGDQIASERLRGHRNVKITDKGRPALKVIFGHGMPLEGFEVLPTLIQLVIFVSQTVENTAIAFPTWPEVVP